MSRRQALTVIGGGIAVTGIGSAVVLRGRWQEPALRPLPPGSLRPLALDTLLALPDALVDHEVDRDRYREFFRFRAEELPGYRALYEEFTDAVESRSADLHADSFAVTTRAQRRQTLMELGLTPEPMQAARGRANLGRALSYDRFIVREVLGFLSATDAWILAGYGRIPGQPRSLAYYRDPNSAAGP